MGHEVYSLQENQVTAEQVKDIALKCDMLFWVHTHGWGIEGTKEVLAIIKKAGIPTVGYHLDLWLGIEREKDLENDPYWNIDYFFSVDRLMVDYLNERENMPQAFFLPAGVFKDETFMLPSVNQFKHDIVFTGSRNYHREWPYRSQLISWLENTYGDRFKHYDHSHIPKMRGARLNELYGQTKVVIGDTLCKNFDYPWYLSDRLFEVTGRGGFMIHPYIEGIETMFNTQNYTFNDLNVEHHPVDTHKAEIITYPFGDFEKLKYLIDYYVQNDEEREAIRFRGHHRTKADHTYTNRLTEILNTINEVHNRKHKNSRPIV
jgi:hypothetical protein